jgi:hypothetical protein
MSLLGNVLATAKCLVEVSEVLISGTVSTTKECVVVFKESIDHNGGLHLTEENKQDIKEIKDSCKRIANNFKKSEIKSN